jgi:hypothetical protein
MALLVSIILTTAPIKVSPLELSLSSPLKVNLVWAKTKLVVNVKRNKRAVLYNINLLNAVNIR